LTPHQFLLKRRRKIKWNTITSCIQVAIPCQTNWKPLLFLSLHQYHEQKEQKKRKKKKMSRFPVIPEDERTEGQKLVEEYATAMCSKIPPGIEWKSADGRILGPFSPML
jgi:hypothetical protein